MRLHDMAKAAVAAVLVTGAVTAPALADEGPVGAEPWQPYEAVDFVSPAGRSCDYDLAVSAVDDEEEYRVVSRYQDGAVRVYEFRGTLISRFTNLASGESVTRDLSGHAWQEMYPDGETMKSFTGVGPFGFGFREADSYPRGYYRLDGLHVITLDPDGTRHMRLAAGVTEDICTTLGQTLDGRTVDDAAAAREATNYWTIREIAGRGNPRGQRCIRDRDRQGRNATMLQVTFAPD